MTAQIIDCDQGSPEWAKARLGMPTSSMFDCVMASGKGGGESKTRRKYLMQLAGERLTGEPMESYSNQYMERGIAMEAEARSAYSLITDQELTRVGFVVNGPKGCSPDSLIGSDGMLEIKTQSPHLLIERLLSGDFPSEHVAQCQGGLWVCERQWIDLAVYYPRLPLFKRRMKRDESYIRRLELAVSVFCEELDEVVEKIKKYGSAL